MTYLHLLNNENSERWNRTKRKIKRFTWRRKSGFLSRFLGGWLTQITRPCLETRRRSAGVGVSTTCNYPSMSSQIVNRPQTDMMSWPEPVITATRLSCLPEESITLAHAHTAHACTYAGMGSVIFLSFLFFRWSFDSFQTVCCSFVVHKTLLTCSSLVWISGCDILRNFSAAFDTEVSDVSR